MTEATINVAVNLNEMTIALRIQDGDEEMLATMDLGANKLVYRLLDAIEKAEVGSGNFRG